jgi:hypothetical protein
VGCTSITRRVAKGNEARQAATFGLVGVDRVAVGVASAGVFDVILATPERALHPGIDEVEDQWRVHANRRMQRRGRIPGPVAHAGHKLANLAGRAHRQSAAVAA